MNRILLLLLFATTTGFCTEPYKTEYFKGRGKNTFIGLVVQNADGTKQVHHNFGMGTDRTLGHNPAHERDGYYDMHQMSCESSNYTTRCDLAEKFLKFYASRTVQRDLRVEAILKSGG